MRKRNEGGNKHEEIPGMGGDEAGFGMIDMAAVSDQFADYLTRIMEASSIIFSLSAN